MDKLYSLLIKLFDSELTQMENGYTPNYKNLDEINNLIHSIDYLTNTCELNETQKILRFYQNKYNI